MSDGPDVSHDLKESALFFHRHPRPGKLEIQATKPLGNQRDLALAYSPGVAAACEAIAADPAEAATLTIRQNLVAVISNGTAVLGPRRHRPARLEAGDGGQSRPVQEIRRHRRVRHRGGREGRRQARRRGRRAGADLRRHQPRGHQGARVLRGRGALQGPHGHSGLPRRPARHGDHRRRRGPQRSRACRQAHRGREDRDLGRRRRRARLPQHPRFARGETREHLGHRHRGRRLRGPRQADGPVEVGLRAEDRGARPRRRDRRRRRLPRPVRRRGAQAGYAEDDGPAAAGARARQPQPRDHAGPGAGDPARCHDLHRALGLPEPGQQRPLLPLHLPRRARRRRPHHQRGDEARGDPRHRGTRPRDAVRGRRPRLWRGGAAVRARPR